MGVRFNPETGEPIRSDADYSPNMNLQEDDFDHTIVYNRTGPGAYNPGNSSNQAPRTQNNAQNNPYGQGSAQRSPYGQNNPQNYPYGQGNARTHGQGNAQSTSYGQGGPQRSPYGQNNAQNYPYGQNSAQTGSYGQGNAQTGSYGLDGTQRSTYGQNNAQTNPYGGNTAQNNYPAQYGNPYGQPPGGTPGPSGKAKKPRKILLPIIIAVAAVCALVGIFFIAKKLLLKPGDEILLAAVKTAEGNQLAGMISETSSEFAKSNAYSTTIDLSESDDYDSAGLKGTVSVDYGKKELAVDGSFTSGGESVKGIFFMDASTIQAQLPDLSSYKLVYDYTTEPTGFIKDFFDEYGLQASAFNSVLQKFWTSKESSSAFQKDLVEITRKNFNSLGWKKTEKKAFTFNDKEIKAKGYTAVLTASAMNSWIKEYRSSYEKYLESTLPQDYLEAVGMSVSDFTDYFNDLEATEDVTVNVYLYKSKIVGIVLKNSEGKTAEVNIKGGAYPLENVSVTADGDETLALKGTTKGDTEELALSLYDGQEAASYSYNKKSGALSVTVYGETLDGTLKKEKTDLILDLSGENSGSVKLDMSFRISPKAAADTTKPTGTELNLNTASTEDLTPFLEDVYNHYN